MLDLTARQIQILRALIEDFIITAEPVGSDTIDKKYSIGVSPATIRNEMIRLTEQGYLAKSHSSAGRTPTPQAMKLYVNELMKERELTVADEVSAKERVWKNRSQLPGLLRQITVVMAEKAHALGIASIDNSELYHSGYANLLALPEFDDPCVIKQVFEMIEEISLLDELFSRETSENQIRVVYGSELSNHNLASIGVIHTSFEAGGHQCRVAVLGSSRFDYPYIIPYMKYIRELVKELVE